MLVETTYVPRAENTTGKVFPKGTCSVLYLLLPFGANVFKKFGCRLHIAPHSST